MAQAGQIVHIVFAVDHMGVDFDEEKDDLVVAVVGIVDQRAPGRTHQNHQVLEGDFYARILQS